MRIDKLLILVVLVVFTSCNDIYNLAVEDLKCENLHNPLGIDKTVPRFSWEIKSKKTGTIQAAFHVLVASTKEQLKKNQADLWNSGKIASESPVWVVYKGETLKPGDHAYWKVRVWDKNGNISDWSQPAEFGIGLLNATDWQPIDLVLGLS